MRSRTALLIAFLLLVPATSVVATHGINHVIHVSGRVIDSQGLPVAGATVTIRAPEEVARENPERPCARQLTTRTQTDEYGDFIACWHSHGISRTAQAQVQVRNQTVTVDMESEPRWGTAYVRLQEPVANASRVPSDWDTSWTVRGRLWRGTSLEDKPVNITLIAEDGRTVTDNTTSGSASSTGLAHFPRPYGVIDHRMTVPQGFTVAEVEIEAAEATLTVPAGSAAHRLNDQVFEMPEPPFDPSTLILPLGLLGGGLAAVGGYFGWQKLKEKREIQKARERSGRKRANK